MRTHADHDDDYCDDHDYGNDGGADYDDDGDASTMLITRCKRIPKWLLSKMLLL